MKKFREGVVKGYLANNVEYKSISEDVEKNFNTDPVKVKGEINEKEWLDYHYKDFH